MIQGATHHLSYEQLRFLNRGPTYVLPCQMHRLSSISDVTLNQILTKQMAPLRQQLKALFTKYPVDLSRRWNFEKEIQQQFIKSFSVPIPESIEQRTLSEKRIIQSIHYQLKRDRLILRRTADKNNTYYLGCLSEFNTMANIYMQNTKCFEMIGAIDDLHSEQQQLVEIIKSIDSALDQLERKRFIPMDYLTKLQIRKKTDINLPYLYFLPETHRDGHITLRPRLSSCKNSPIQTLATYLDQLLRPLFDKFSQSTTFLNGADFIQKLQHYCIQKESLSSTTQFVTFKIHNLYTRISHSDILTTLNQFSVHQATNGRIQRLTTDAIQELTALVLHNNIFTYNGKMYRYLKGGPSNVSFIGLLCDIYLQNWQIPLVRQIRNADKFYGRYNDIGILMWDGLSDTLHNCFSELNQQHPDIQITTSISSDVHFLNAYIENQGGSLYTCVYHDPMIQPFLLPYIANHPRLGHRQWFRFALIRAGQYCLCFEDFQEELVQIELTFLANGYSLDFVEYHTDQFFKRFNPSHGPFNVNRLTYTSLRIQLFRHFRQQKLDIEEGQQLEIKHQLIQLHYLFDWGSRCDFNRKFHQLWSDILNKDPTFQKLGLKIILSTKHCYLSNTLLASFNTSSL